MHNQNHVKQEVEGAPKMSVTLSLSSHFTCVLIERVFAKKKKKKKKKREREREEGTLIRYEKIYLGRILQVFAQKNKNTVTMKQKALNIAWFLWWRPRERS